MFSFTKNRKLTDKDQLDIYLSYEGTKASAVALAEKYGIKNYIYINHVVARMRRRIELGDKIKGINK